MVSFKKLREMVQVKGNGNVVSKEYPISSFLRLHIAVRGVTELIQSQEEKVEVEMDENLLEYFSAMNSGRTLYVGTEGALRKPAFTHARVKIYFRQIDHLVIRCEGGEVRTPMPIILQSPLDLLVQSQGDVQLNVQAPQLKASLQMQGNITLTGDCGEVDLKTQSIGNLLARGLFASELKLKNSSQGNIEVFADKKIWIKHHGQGYIHYYGDAQLMDVTQWGQGEVRHCS